MTFYPDFHDLDFSLRVKEAIEKEKEEEKGKRENEVDGDMMRKENEEKEREIVKVLSLSVIFNKGFIPFLFPFFFSHSLFLQKRQNLTMRKFLRFRVFLVNIVTKCPFLRMFGEKN